MTATTQTRRERQRQATYDEIVEVSRRLLRSTAGEVSLRAVATEMGITPPALYRYVDSHAELLSLVAQSVFDDVVGQMAEARDRYPDDDPAAQIVAASAAFRRWALAHRTEFRLVFATPHPEGEEASATEGSGTPGEAEALRQACANEAEGTQFQAFFADLFLRLWERYHFRVPTDDELHPSVVVALEDHVHASGLPQGIRGSPAGMVWLFERAWARLYGIVTLEVFGHLRPALIDSGALFAATVLDIGRDIGLEDEWTRLQPIALGSASG